MEQVLINVAVEAPLPQALTYIWDNAEAPRRGLSIEVPLGLRKAKGVVVGLDAKPNDFELKSVLQILDDRPLLTEEYLSWLEWMADYYMHPLGLVTSQVFPPLKPQDPNQKPRGRKSPVVQSLPLDQAPVLTDEQKQCVDAIPVDDTFHTHLVHGVTGSGKTEVYLHLLERCLEQGKQGLVLVPEIALTPQLVGRFSARFGSENIAVIHSQLTSREKTNHWWAAYRGEKPILIGARSALFCPLPNLGLIIVDEEHEPSYKQDQKLKYHARDAAVMLGQKSRCPVVLGSATPSLESWNNALEGRYKLHEMTQRVSNRPLPQIQVVDLRQERTRRKEGLSSDLPFWLSPTLHEELQQCLDRKEQAALFLNRRGVAQTILCEDCGYMYECPNCAISLTLHGKKNMICHYCNFSQILTDHCTSCHEGVPKPIGIGTEQIESDLVEIFPEARVSRADRDQISSRQDMENLVHQMEKHEIDILVGTQMIAKGLDFPKLTLVGLVLADVGFNLPDFRTVERSYQLITQVSGRSGRHVEDGGKVVIQTYNPDYQALKSALVGNFKEFAINELEVRKQLSYPPFGRVASFQISGSPLRKVQDTAFFLRQRCEDLQGQRPHYSMLQILGPSEAPIVKIKGKFRYHLLIKSPSAKHLNAFCRQILGDHKWIDRRTKVQVDIDPLNLM